MPPENMQFRTGLDAYQQIVKKSKASGDPVVNEQVVLVGRRIAEATDKRGYQWEFRAFYQTR